MCAHVYTPHTRKARTHSHTFPDQMNGWINVHLPPPKSGGGLTEAAETRFHPYGFQRRHVMSRGDQSKRHSHTHTRYTSYTCTHMHRHTHSPHIKHTTRTHRHAQMRTLAVHHSHQHTRMHTCTHVRAHTHSAGEHLHSAHRPCEVQTATACRGQATAEK